MSATTSNRTCVVAALPQLRRFLTEVAPFDRLRPAPDLVIIPPTPAGHHPLALSDTERRMLAAYLPAGGRVTLDVAPDGAEARWFDPRTGELAAAVVGDEAGLLRATSPGGAEGTRAFDWALIVKRHPAAGTGRGR